MRTFEGDLFISYLLTAALAYNWRWFRRRITSPANCGFADTMFFSGCICRQTGLHIGKRGCHLLGAWSAHSVQWLYIALRRMISACSSSMKRASYFSFADRRDSPAAKNIRLEAHRMIAAGIAGNANRGTVSQVRGRKSSVLARAVEVGNRVL